MRNIELKARVSDLDAARRVAGDLCGGPDRRLVQTDTYFDVRSGRLKLREIASGGVSSAELIFYDRADVSGARRCEYEIAPVSDPAPLKKTLTAAFGVRATVMKRRDVHMWNNVRIHLDTVDGLGTFVEFEAVMSDDASDSEGEALNEELRRRFGIEDADLIDCSYVDLVSRP